MSQLWSDILKKWKYEEIEKAELQYKQIHIAAPIQSYSDEEQDDSQINLSDNEGDEDINFEDDTNDNANTDEILSSDHWLRIVENWIEMLDTENHLNNGDNVSEEPIEFELGGRIIHPADDPIAKCDLLNLFNNSLEAPVYLAWFFNKFVIEWSFIINFFTIWYYIF